MSIESIEKNEQALKKINSEKSKVLIGYMMNPDKVYYNEMDDEIIRNLESNGAEVHRFNIEDIHIFVNKSTGIEIYVKNEKVIWDGFLSYGYMSDFHYEAYHYIVSSLEMAGIVTLHTSENEKILNNKFQQSLRFSKFGVPVPNTHMGFSIPTYTNIASQHYQGKSIIKKLDDYGGDGVSKCDHWRNLVNLAAKNLWRNEYTLFQEYVPDSEGRSIRVLCINGKTVAVAEYIDKSDNFKSNVSFEDLFTLKSLMGAENYEKYSQLGETAVKSIGNLTVAGVDILDSEKLGCVVLEVNGWPDIYDIAFQTKQDVFGIFTSAFIGKCCVNK
jgi:ribosomal protein S6--L-glutamate ligase